MLTRPQPRDMTTPAPASTLAILCAIALIVGFVGNLAILLPNIFLETKAAGGLAIGISTAAQALGIVTSGPVALYLLRRAGTAHVMMLGCCIAAVGLLSLSMADSAPSISWWRFVLANGTGLMVIVSEFVVTARTPLRHRGTLIAIYAACFSLGTALSPGLISLVGSNLGTAYGIALISLVCAALGAGMAGLRGRIERPARGNIFGLFRGQASSPLWAAFIYGMLENGLVALLTIYALRVGYSLSEASAIATASFVGVLALQVPVGRLSDRTNPRLLLVLATLVAIACLAVLFVTRPALPAMAGLAFLLGGVCDVFYTVGLADMSRRVAKAELADGNACFVLLCGAGELFGPLVAGWSLETLGPAGFLAAFIGVLAVYLAAQIGIGATTRVGDAVLQGEAA
jgi:MFS family permease